MVNSFGQFTGDVRVSGHISQAGGGEVRVCLLTGFVGGFLFFLLAEGWSRCEDGLRLQKSLLEILLPVCHLSRQTNGAWTWK